MKTWLLTLILFGFGSKALAVEGSTYFIGQSFSLLQNQTCSNSLDQISQLLFGAKGEHRRLAVYSSVRCTSDDKAPLRVEVLFEPESEAQRVELEAWIDILETATWNNQTIKTEYITSIFWNTYGVASKADGVYIAGFEKPALARSFEEIVVRKNQFKNDLADSSAEPLHAILLNSVGEFEFSKWKSDYLPKTEVFELALHIYFLTGNESVAKSSIVYLLKRDCRKLSCL